MAGLALLNLPWSWIGVKREGSGYSIEEYDFTTGKSATAPLAGPHVWLRVHCDFDLESSTFSYSQDGKDLNPLGPEFISVFQLTTFQGVRFALFDYNAGGKPGGQADFNSFTVFEPRPRGLTKPIPLGKSIAITDIGTGNALAVVGNKLQSVAGDRATAFRVVDRGRGRIARRRAGAHHRATGLREDGHVHSRRTLGDDHAASQGHHKD
jgi:hypothetical protein